MGRARKYKRYSPEFKTEALKRASELIEKMGAPNLLWHQFRQLS